MAAASLRFVAQNPQSIGHPDCSSSQGRTFEGPEAAMIWKALLTLVNMGGRTAVGSVGACESLLATRPKNPRA